jgi:hypothetical protein
MRKAPGSKGKMTTTNKMPGGSWGMVSGVAAGDICAVRKAQFKLLQVLDNPVRVV